MNDYKYDLIVQAGAKETNPTTSTVLVDSGDVPEGTYIIHVIVGASAAATFSIQHRNHKNDTTVDDVPIVYAAAGQSAEFVIAGWRILKNESIRVLPEASITGTAAASLFLRRVS